MAKALYRIRNTPRSHIGNPLYYPYQLYNKDKEKCYQVLNDLASDIVNCDEENLYSYDYKRQRNEEISYYNFEEFVKQLKLDDYKNQMEKLSENLGGNANPSLDMLLDLLKELSN